MDSARGVLHRVDRQRGNQMSEFHIQIVRIGKVEKHPNADSLSVTQVHGGYPVIFQTGNFKEGDLAVYLPVDAIVPDTEEWHWLAPAEKLYEDGKVKTPRPAVGEVPVSYRTIRAKKLRGIFSMGLLHPAPPGVNVGDNVQELLGITKYEELPPEEGSDRALTPKGVPVPYYDLEGLRRYLHVLQDGEEVVITEKLNGENARYLIDSEGQFHVGSHGQWKQHSGKNNWSKVATLLSLENRLRQARSEIVVYGETHGYVGGFSYGQKSPTLRIFDVYDREKQKWWDWDDVESLSLEIGIPTVPVLFRGPWSPELLTLAEGPSTLDPSHVREGFVVKPTVERTAVLLREDGVTIPAKSDRVIFKMIGEGFHLRKRKQ